MGYEQGLKYYWWSMIGQLLAYWLEIQYNIENRKKNHVIVYNTRLLFQLN